MSCIFCDILTGESSANFVYTDDLCAAFMDIRPINPGHVLVVPRQHAVLITGLDEPSTRQIFWVAQQVDIALRKTELKCEAVNLFLADGRAAGQEVPHVHLHVMPRYHGDGHHLRFSPAFFHRTPLAELEHNAALIRQQLGGAQ
jgi:histidine triad (HIT) family protein